MAPNSLSWGKITHPWLMMMVSFLFLTNTQTQKSPRKIRPQNPLTISRGYVGRCWCFFFSQKQAVCGGSSRIVFSPLGYALIAISSVEASVCGSGRQFCCNERRTWPHETVPVQTEHTQTLVTVDGAWSVDRERPLLGSAPLSALLLLSALSLFICFRYGSVAASALTLTHFLRKNEINT